jgi:O-antigen ligase
MRVMVGLVGLLITLAIVGVLVRQQMKTTHSPTPTLQAPPSANLATQTDTAAVATSSTAAQNSQQIQQQFKQALDQAVQTRLMPDDTP